MIVRPGMRRKLWYENLMLPNSDRGDGWEELENAKVLGSQVVMWREDIVFSPRDVYAWAS